MRDVGASVYAFGDVFVDTGRFRVVRSGQPIDLEPKALEVLVFLIERRERLVLKEELLDGVWKDTFVTPNALTRVIAQLRKAFDDDAQEARIIETVPRRGYRFLPPVTVEPSTGTMPPAAPAATVRPVAGRKPTALRVGLPLLAGAFIALTGWVWLRPASSAVPGLSRLSQLTTVGYEANPAISPDGRRLAFTGDENGVNELYVRPLVDGPPIKLTSEAGQKSSPAWSPDGESVAYMSGVRGGIWVVGALGGTPRQVSTSGSDPEWSPDGRQLAFSTYEGAFAERGEIVVVPSGGGTPAPVTSPGAPRGGHRRPAFSRDGRRIAFSVFDGSQGTSIWIAALAGGEPTRLAERVFPNRIAFTPGDDAVCWSGLGPTASVGLWCVDLTSDPPAAPRALLQGVSGAESLSIARDGTIAYAVRTSDSDLWSLPLAAGLPAGEPAPLMRNTNHNTLPVFSPSGQHVAYVAWRPGTLSDAWLVNVRDGTTSVLSPGTEDEYFPTWSADGRSVLLALGQGASRQVVRVALDTRRAEPVAGLPRELSNLALSPDGRDLAYHLTGVRGGLSAWIVPVAGGTPTRLAPPDVSAGYPAWSRDGKRLAIEVEHAGKTQIWVVNRDGTGLRQLTSAPGQNWPHSWAPDGDRIAFAGERGGVWNVWAVSASTGALQQLTRFTAQNGFVRYPAWSPLDERIVFVRSTATSKIWTGRLTTSTAPAQ
jgi:Tol biopolymer transport system component/DNA-binding winged helix-turn-helix (wHTH) protein